MIKSYVSSPNTLIKIVASFFLKKNVAFAGKLLLQFANEC